jgi:antitoxin component of RelBE/YafQ-DinJ toxin-antitoxin module
MIKNNIYSVRLTDDQRARLNRKAQEMGVKPSELLRTQIFKLLDYGSGLQNYDSYRKGKS